MWSWVQRGLAEIRLRIVKIATSGTSFTVDLTLATGPCSTFMRVTSVGSLISGWSASNWLISNKGNRVIQGPISGLEAPSTKAPISLGWKNNKCNIFFEVMCFQIKKGGRWPKTIPPLSAEGNGVIVKPVESANSIARRSSGGAKGTIQGSDSGLRTKTTP